MTGWEIEYAHSEALAEERARRTGQGVWRSRAAKALRMRSEQYKAETKFIKKVDRENAERIQALIDNGVDPAIICKDCGKVHSRRNRGTGLEELMKQIRR